MDDGRPVAGRRPLDLSRAFGCGAAVPRWSRDHQARNRRFVQVNKAQLSGNSKARWMGQGMGGVKQQMRAKGSYREGDTHVKVAHRQWLRLFLSKQAVTCGWGLGRSTRQTEASVLLRRSGMQTAICKQIALFGKRIATLISKGHDRAKCCVGRLHSVFRTGFKIRTRFHQWFRLVFSMLRQVNTAKTARF